MTKISGEDSELVIINQLLEWNHLYAQCLWGWMKVGIKFSLIWVISLEEHTVLIILKHWGFKYMLIVESEEYISVIGYIVKMNYHLNSNCSCLSKNKHNDFHNYL
jgi:hypothetical protein